MKTKKLITKSVLICLVFLIVGITSQNKEIVPYSDPLCNTWNKDGTVCERCAYRSFLGKEGKCQPVSDNCRLWNSTSGYCYECYPEFGLPKNGVCSYTPPDDHCAKYGYIDTN